MKMAEDMDGQRTSIHVEGLTEFHWSPNKLMLIFTAFPEAENIVPRCVFMDLKSRRQLLVHTMKDSDELKLYLHPQGTYVACMNAFRTKKALKYSVELFDCSNPSSIPHQ